MKKTRLISIESQPKKIVVVVVVVIGVVVVVVVHVVVVVIPVVDTRNIPLKLGGNQVIHYNTPSNHHHTTITTTAPSPQHHIIIRPPSPWYHIITTPPSPLQSHRGAYFTKFPDNNQRGKVSLFLRFGEEFVMVEQYCWFLQVCCYRVAGLHWKYIPSWGL